MSLLALATLDWIALAVYLSFVLAVGFYFSRSQETTKDYFLASRNMHWLPVSISLVVTLFSALSFTGVPAEAFRHGLVMIPQIFDLWIIMPLLLIWVIPFFYNLEIFTAYQYLERRFDVNVRIASSGVFIAWRMLWLGAVVYAPCKVLLFTMGFDERQDTTMLYTLLVGLGIFTTFYTFLGGLKAVIWTDVLQFCIVIGGMASVFWFALVGPEGVGVGTGWATAQSLGLGDAMRLAPTEGQGIWHDRWVVWAALGHYTLAMMAFYTADQITLQRYLTTPDLKSARRAMVANSVARSVMIPLLVMLGVALHVFYHHHPERHAELLSQAGKPEVRADVASGGEVPAAAAEDLRQVVDANYVFPYFISHELPPGLAGLIVAALFAAAMSSLDSGLNSLSTSLIVDFHQRLGIGKASLARLRGKRPDQLDERDEMMLARPLCLVLGLIATLVAIAMSRVEDIFFIMIAVTDTFGAPPLAVFLLGMFTRRVGPRGALVALLGGAAFTAWMFTGDLLKGAGPEWLTALCPQMPWDTTWNIAVSLAFSMGIGYATSLVCDAPPERGKLDGLSAGQGRPGLPGGK